MKISPKMTRRGPREPKIGQEGPKMAQDKPNMAARRAQDGNVRGGGGARQTGLRGRENKGGGKRLKANRLYLTAWWTPRGPADSRFIQTPTLQSSDRGSDVRVEDAGEMH